eukprot:COSAG04_NODE_4804_length_1884_cov_1.783436_1_plen_168_part_10
MSRLYLRFAAWVQENLATTEERLCSAKMAAELAKHVAKVEAVVAEMREDGESEHDIAVYEAEQAVEEAKMGTAEVKRSLQQCVAAARYDKDARSAVPLAFAEYLDMDESVLKVLRKKQDNGPKRAEPGAEPEPEPEPEPEASLLAAAVCFARTSLWQQPLMSTGIGVA